MFYFAGMIGFIGNLVKQQKSIEFAESVTKNNKISRSYLNTDLNGLRKDITPNGFEL